MKKGETIIERTTFSVNVFVRILVPPFYSFARLERYCQFRIRKNPKAYLPRWFLAGLYKDHRKNEDARREYNEIKDLGYLTYRDRIDCAEVLTRLHNYEDVIEILLPVLDRCQRERDCCRHMGIAYLGKKEFKKAFPFLEKVVEHGSRRYEDYWNLGYCCDRMGDFEKARKIYTDALLIRSDSKELKENLALVHIRIGQGLLDSNLMQAEEHFKKALKVNPGDPEATRIIENVRKIREGIDLANKLKTNLQ